MLWSHFVILETLHSAHLLPHSLQQYLAQVSVQDGDHPSSTFTKVPTPSPPSVPPLPSSTYSTPLFPFLFQTFSPTNLSSLRWLAKPVPRHTQIFGGVTDCLKPFLVWFLLGVLVLSYVLVLLLILVFVLILDLVMVLGLNEGWMHGTRTTIPFLCSPSMLEMKKGHQKYLWLQ